jgi:cellobiose-specific phosphotransferase system component IIC
MTFGYDAAFQKAGNLTTSILDFAKALLFDLKYAKDANMAELDVGRVSLSSIFSRSTKIWRVAGTKSLTPAWIGSSNIRCP